MKGGRGGDVERETCLDENISVFSLVRIKLKFVSKFLVLNFLNFVVKLDQVDRDQDQEGKETKISACTYSWTTGPVTKF